ncbi:MAG: hypothetical protein JXA19_00970 [Anaerolineales bacterium]|nr:hypothetical protein [Anaerolineales bacterium]
MSSKTIRASEIGTYLFCNKAWWYQKKGVKSSNENELLSGTSIHEKHSKIMRTIGCMQVIGYTLFLASIVFLSIYILGFWFN